MLWLLLITLLVGCRSDTGEAPASDAPEAVGQPDPEQEVTRGWMGDSQPFSPTLPHLFDEGRIVALPPEQAQLPDQTLLSDDYAFSAVDRYGRVYHFDRGLRWGMTPGAALASPLPASQWDVAWNPQAGALEMLITAPWQNATTFQVLRWNGSAWQPLADAAASTATAQLTAAPPARVGAQRLFTPEKRRWYVAGGAPAAPATTSTQATTSATLASDSASWVFDAGAWQPWVPAMPDGAPLPAASLGVAPPALGPPLGQTRALLGTSPDGGFGVLLDSGDLWLTRGEGWQWRGRFPMHELFIARYLPFQNQFLFVWSRGRGRDRVQLASFLPTPGKPDEVPDELNQTALVTVNEEDEGLWRGWGRVRTVQGSGGSREVFLPDDFETPGDDAIKIDAEYSEVLFRRNDIEMLELPPRLSGLRPEAAAWVPALNGLVIPSADGLGLQAERQPFFPDAAQTTGTAGTSAATRQIDVIQRTFRIWVFKGDLIDWLKPPSDIHPLIGFPEIFPGPDGRQRTLTSTFPEPGLFRYDFRETNNENEQWTQSPLLTLRGLPQVGWTPESQLFLCPPVVWGNPAQVVLVGWCGERDKPRKIDDPTGSGETEAHRVVPARGFMARIDALNPREWTVSPLPIPYCEGARLVINPDGGVVYLVGGRIAIPQRVDDQQLFLMQSHYLVWEWDGKAWRRIEPAGEQPQMRATSTVAFHPPSHALLCLTPRTLFAFDQQSWRMLWRRAKQEKEEWPEAMGLYVHPLSGLTLGAWFKSATELHVWEKEGWEPVLVGNGEPLKQPGWPSGEAVAQSGPWPMRVGNVIPARVPDSFVVIDGQRLADLRMDVPRDRDQDRLLEGHLLQLARREGINLRLPTPGLLGSPAADR